MNTIKAKITAKQPYDKTLLILGESFDFSIRDMINHTTPHVIKKIKELINTLSESISNLCNEITAYLFEYLKNSYAIFLIIINKI